MKRQNFKCAKEEIDHGLSKICAILKDYGWEGPYQKIIEARKEILKLSLRNLPDTSEESLEGSDPPSNNLLA